MKSNSLRTLGKPENSPDFHAMALNFCQLHGIGEKTGVRARSVPGLHNLAKAVEQSKDLQMITGCDGVIQYVNPAFEEATGFSKAEVVGKTPAILKSGFQSADFYAALWKLLHAGHTYRGIMINRRRNGEIFHEEKTISPIRDASGNITHFFATGQDVTQRVREFEHLQHLANYDCLTGLPNRSLFVDRLQHALSHAARAQKQVALLYLDVDRFKQINDSHGHATGDELLQAVASQLKRCTRQEDTVARLGGDEFVVILSEVDGLDSVAKVLDKIVASFRQRLQAGKLELSASTSIGVSIYPRDGSRVSDLLKLADIAMYRTKAAGGNGYSFYCDQSVSHAHAVVGSGKSPALAWLENRESRNEARLQQTP